MLILAFALEYFVEVEPLPRDKLSKQCLGLANVSIRQSNLLADFLLQLANIFHCPVLSFLIDFLHFFLYLSHLGKDITTIWFTSVFLVW